MFPLNLQRNIVQLDRQISLLENECKNMEMEKKKKNQKPDPTYSSCSKNSNARLKAPTVRVTMKKLDSMKRNRKPTPPVSSRLQSTGSLPSHCSRAWCENNEGRKTHFCGPHTNACAYSCQSLGSPQCNIRRESKCVQCVCCNEMSVSDVVNDDPSERNKKDHVLLFPNARGTIEVTVTQKSNNGKENSPIRCKSPRKSINSEKDIEKDLEGCKCQIKGQKWSEILCVDSSKKKQSNTGPYMKSKNIADETKVIYQPLNFNNRKLEENMSYVNQNNCSSIQEETFEVPVKLSPQLCKTKKPEINSNKFEKQIQCSLENSKCVEPTKEFKDPAKIFQFLVNQFQQMSSKDLKNSSMNKGSCTKAEETFKEDTEESKNNSASNGDSKNNVSYINAVKHHCENLLKEKSLLTEQLAAKDNAIALMKKREEEYLSVISSLKSNLEKTKENAQECNDAAKQLQVIKTKLFEQIRVSEALKKKLQKYQEIEDNRTLENAKLKTELKILQLEAQKHEILLAGKTAEIKRYREEIENFQRQISDHLNSLKTNAQMVDVEKMMEAIMQQSQVFAQADLESLLEKDEKEENDENDEKESSRLQNVLMHSSPTSTKNSVVNSSWKQISSIHEHDQSKASSEVIYLNNEKSDNNFFELFGEKLITERKLPEIEKKISLEKLLEKTDVKNSSSFTSCTSLHDDNNSSKSTSRDSLISKETLMSVNDTVEEQVEGNSCVSPDKAQNNIDELLKNMKLKFSKEIFDTSLPSCTTEDYLDISQISSISPL